MTKSVIGSDGFPQFGIFDEPVQSVDPADFDYRSPMGRQHSDRLKRFRFKQFQAVGVVSPSLIAGCAIVNLNYIAAAFVYTFDPNTKKLSEYSLKAPLGRGCSVMLDPRDGRTTFDGQGSHVEFAANSSAGTTRLRASMAKGLEIDVTFSITDPPLTPLAICTQAGKQGWVYAEKVAGAPATGSVREGSNEWDLREIDACAHYDFSSGFMRRETFWNWACLSGKVASGTLVGLNVSCGANETSYSENCLWVDGERSLIGQAQFGYDRDRLFEPWTVRTNDGAVDLSFEPMGEHVERLNLAVVTSNFHQIFGRFSGALRPPGENPINVDGLYGFVEEQYAKW